MRPTASGATSPQGMLFVSLPRALAQALQIEKGATLEWVLEDGELVLRRSREVKPARRQR